MGLHVKSPLFGLDFRYVLELQAKTWRTVLDTDDDDANWLLGRAKAEHNNLERQNFSKSHTRVIVGIARNLLDPAPEWLSSLLRFRQSQFGSSKKKKNIVPLPLLVAGAGPEDLNLTSLNANVRSKYQHKAFATTS